ncbi:hypothetical protein E2C01_040985 [Portunus trituberculatus]|uniref:Uncharacterized protein n=1 Tax=Portunus trituberculatus TaxID=210409 RepID=A0A5B7FS90_PORTR|nr:hypothetical protein [Portunus trituberculatus]
MPRPLRVQTQHMVLKTEGIFDSRTERSPPTWQRDAKTPNRRLATNVTIRHSVTATNPYNGSEGYKEARCLFPRASPGSDKRGRSGVLGRRVPRGGGGGRRRPAPTRHPGVRRLTNQHNPSKH